MCVYACMYGCMDVNRVLNEICAQLGMFRCKIYVVYSLGSQTLRTSACVTFIYSAILYVKINVFEQNQTINKCVCMHVCMDVWMWTKFWMKYVHNNLGCFAARFIWSYSLGNITLRTSASWMWILENIKIAHDTHTHMCVYIGMYGKIRNKQGIEQNRSKKSRPI